MRERGLPIDHTTIYRWVQRDAPELEGPAGAVRNHDAATSAYGADPAVASGTFVTTITDVVGFFSFLGIATLWVGLK